MSRVPLIEAELKRVFSDVSGLPVAEFTREATFFDQGLDSLSLTQATLEIERVFGLKLRFRRMLEDLDNVARLAALLDQELPAGRFAHVPAPAPALAAALAPAAVQMLVPAVQDGSSVHQLIQQQMQLIAQQLTLLSGSPAPVAAPALADRDRQQAWNATDAAYDRSATVHGVIAAQAARTPAAPAVLQVLPVSNADQDTTHDCADFAVPANATEQAIAAIWARLLNVTQVGRNDNFFNLGGHSLLARRAVQEMQRITGEKIPASRLIFESLSQIAAGIAIEPACAAPTDSLPAEVHAESDAANELPMIPSRPHWLKRLWRKWS
jgi:acyl carrier protein